MILREEFEDELKIEIDWGCIKGKEDLEIEPEWDEEETYYICHSCDNGPCYQ